MNTGMTTTIEKPQTGLSPAQTSAGKLRDEAWRRRLADAVTDPSASRNRAWAKAQRRAHRLGKLTAGRKADLDRDLPGWSANANDRWQETANDLVDFEDLHGCFPTIAGDDEARRLWRWLTYQRTRLTTGKLPRARRKWLDRKLPGWSGLEAGHHAG